MIFDFEDAHDRLLPRSRLLDCRNGRASKQVKHGLTHSATVKLALTAIFFGGWLGRMEDAERNNHASRQTESLQRAISLVGGGTRLARALGVTKQAVSAWRRPPAVHVAEISRLSGIDPHQLRPDVFPHPDSTIQDDAA